MRQVRRVSKVAKSESENLMLNLALNKLYFFASPPPPSLLLYPGILHCCKSEFCCPMYYFSVVAPGSPYIILRICLRAESDLGLIRERRILYRGNWFWSYQMRFAGRWRMCSIGRSVFSLLWCLHFIWQVSVALQVTLDIDSAVYTASVNRSRDLLVNLIGGQVSRVSCNLILGIQFIDILFLINFL